MSHPPHGGPALRPCRTAEVLLQLLDRLCPPSALIDPVKTQLLSLPAEAEEARVRSAVNAAVEVLTAATAGQRQQLHALGKTLGEVSQELQDALGDLGQVIRQTNDGLGRRQSLEEAVRAELQGFELVAAEVDDVASLQRTVATTVKSVLGHLGAHSAEQHAEEKGIVDCLAQFEARMRDMAARLKEHGDTAAFAAAQQLVDPVTGCPNRLAFAERSSTEWAQWKSRGTALTLAVFGLDRLVEINERFGHLAGDQVLRIVAKLAAEQMPKTGFLCRHGGGEFVALLPDLDLPSARACAEQMRKTIAAFRFHNKGEPVPVTVSSGSARFREGDSVEDAFERAHKALRLAKSRSGNLCLTEEDV